MFPKILCVCDPVLLNTVGIEDVTNSGVTDVVADVR